MHKSLIPLLMCPACHGDLEVQITREDEVHLIEGRFVCNDCKREYPVIDGIGIFLDVKENRGDFWKRQEDFASRFRMEHPIRFYFLTRTFFGNIRPEDYFLKGMLLEDEGILERAMKRVYTRDYLIGYEKTKQVLAEIEKGDSSPILEIACGRGGFFKPFLKSRLGSGVYIASDFSPTVLRSDLKWLTTNGLGKRATFLAFDAKAMPFKNYSIPGVVSNLGFPNVQNDGKAVTEAFRVLTASGNLITNFMFTKKETENYVKAKEYGLDRFYTRENVERVFEEAGFRFTLEELHRGSVSPTPGGIDLLPVVQDTYSFCVLRATKP